MPLVDQIIGVESGGNPNARNPRSSASGLGQFIDSTWLSTLARHRPDLTEGKSREELLALKSDPQLSRDMTAAYAADNAGILSRAGLPVTPGSTYLAHFAGPQGAVGILNADPSAPVSSILTPAAVRANPFLQGMSAADLRAWADRKMGGGGPVTGPAPAQPGGAAPSGPIELAAAVDPAPAEAAPGSDSGSAQAIADVLAMLNRPVEPEPAPMLLPPKRKIDWTSLQRRISRRV